MSALITHTVVFTRPDARRMTWADVMADRIARGLEKPLPAKSTRKAKAPTGPRTVDVDGVQIDARDPRNTRPHTAPPFTGALPTSAARAASLRKGTMLACACRLCALALNPPRTFAEHTAFCVDLVREQEVELFGGPRKVSTHEDNRHPDARQKSKDARDWELAVYGPAGCLGSGSPRVDLPAGEADFGGGK